MGETESIVTQQQGELKMFTTYTRPSGKQFEIIAVLKPAGPLKTWVQYKEGKYISTQAVWNKHLA